jgi:hypothetical protein
VDRSFPVAIVSSPVRSGDDEEEVELREMLSDLMSQYAPVGDRGERRIGVLPERSRHEILSVGARSSRRLMDPPPLPTRDDEAARGLGILPRMSLLNGDLSDRDSVESDEPSRRGHRRRSSGTHASSTGWPESHRSGVGSVQPSHRSHVSRDPSVIVDTAGFFGGMGLRTPSAENRSFVFSDATALRPAGSFLISPAELAKNVWGRPVAPSRAPLEALVSKEVNRQPEFQVKRSSKVRIGPVVYGLSLEGGEAELVDVEYCSYAGESTALPGVMSLPLLFGSMWQAQEMLGLGGFDEWMQVESVRPAPVAAAMMAPSTFSTQRSAMSASGDRGRWGGEADFSSSRSGRALFNPQSKEDVQVLVSGLRGGALVVDEGRAVHLSPTVGSITPADLATDESSLDAVAPLYWPDRLRLAHRLTEHTPSETAKLAELARGGVLQHPVLSRGHLEMEEERLQVGPQRGAALARVLVQSGWKYVPERLRAEDDEAREGDQTPALTEDDEPSAFLLGSSGGVASAVQHSSLDELVEAARHSIGRPLASNPRISQAERMARLMLPPCVLKGISIRVSAVYLSVKGVRAGACAHPISTLHRVVASGQVSLLKPVVGSPELFSHALFRRSLDGADLSPIDLACRMRRSAMLQSMLQWCKPSYSGSSGTQATVLHHAVVGGSAQCVDAICRTLLLRERSRQRVLRDFLTQRDGGVSLEDSGAFQPATDVFEARDAFGRTPLSLACGISREFWDTVDSNGCFPESKETFLASLKDVGRTDGVVSESSSSREEGTPASPRRADEMSVMSSDGTTASGHSHAASASMVLDDGVVSQHSVMTLSGMRVPPSGPLPDRIGIASGYHPLVQWDPIWRRLSSSDACRDAQIASRPRSTPSRHEDSTTSQAKRNASERASFASRLAEAFDTDAKAALSALRVTEGGGAASTTFEFPLFADLDPPARSIGPALVLLLHGADPSQRDNRGSTPLMHACAAGNWRVVLALAATRRLDPVTGELQCPAAPDAVNLDGDNALLLACRRPPTGPPSEFDSSAPPDRPELMGMAVRALLAVGSRIRQTNRLGRTALHEAACRGHSTAMRALLFEQDPPCERTIRRDARNLLVAVDVKGQSAVSLAHTSVAARVPGARRCLDLLRHAQDIISFDVDNVPEGDEDAEWDSDGSYEFVDGDE